MATARTGQATASPSAQRATDRGLFPSIGAVLRRHSPQRATHVTPNRGNSSPYGGGIWHRGWRLDVDRDTARADRAAREGDHADRPARDRRRARLAVSGGGWVGSRCLEIQRQSADGQSAALRSRYGNVPTPSAALSRSTSAATCKTSSWGRAEHFRQCVVDERERD